MTSGGGKPGIFFEGVDIYGLPGTDSYWNRTVRHVCQELTTAGEACEPLNLQDSENTKLSFETADLPPYAICWNFNSGRWAMYEGERVRIINILPVKNIVLLWDHPVHLAETIREMQSFDQRIDRPPFHIGVMDSGHMDYLREMGIGPERIFRWRQAGPEPTAETPDFADREVDYLFHGTINDVEEFDAFCARLGITDGAVQSGLQNAIAAIIETPVDVYTALRKQVLEPSGWDLDAVAAAPLCRELDRLTRDIRRFALLTGLKELPVHYIGRVAEGFRAANPNGVFTGPLPFNEIETYLRNTKTVLYDTINFRDAAVMRLFYSIAEGCVPALEMNAYLSETFSGGENAVSLTLGDPGGNTAKLRDMVGSVETGRRLAEAARETCRRHHAWRHSIGPLLDAIRA